MEVNKTDCTIDWAEIRRTCIVRENRKIVALNKREGISLIGERHGPDIIGEAKKRGEQLYPVNRIDKVTSGLVLLAKDTKSHGPLTRQFVERSVRKTYLAIVAAPDVPAGGVIDLPLVTAGSGRVRIAGDRGAITYDEAQGAWLLSPGADNRYKRTYPSLTVFAKVGRIGDSAVLLVRPITGRRHQIRVHLAWIGLPIEGDPLFDRTGLRSRTALHSWRLSLRLEASAPPVDLEATPGPDFWHDFGPDAAEVANLMATAEETSKAPGFSGASERFKAGAGKYDSGDSMS